MEQVGLPAVTNSFAQLFNAESNAIKWFDLGDVAALREMFHGVTVVEATSAWNVAACRPMMLWCHAKKVSVDAFVSPRSQGQFRLMHNDFGSGSGNGVATVVVVSIDHSASRHQWIDLGWSE